MSPKLSPKRKLKVKSAEKYPNKKQKLNNKNLPVAHGIDFFFKSQRDGLDRKGVQDVKTGEKKFGEQLESHSLQLKKHLPVSCKPQEDVIVAEGTGLCDFQGRVQDENDKRIVNLLKRDSEGKAYNTLTQECEQQAISCSFECQSYNRKGDEDIPESSVTSIPTHKDPLEFIAEDYSEITSSWINSRAPYSLLADTFKQVTATRSRLKIVDLLVNCMRLLILHDPQSLLPAVWNTANAISPPFSSLKLNLGPSVISRAICAVSGISGQRLKALNDKYGDPGDVAFEAKAHVQTLLKPERLTIYGVYETLLQIARAKGSGMLETKQRLVEKLFRSAKGEEVRFIGRTLVQNLRIGGTSTTMLIVLSRAFTLTKPKNSMWNLVDMTGKSKEERIEIFKKAEETLKLVYARRPNYNDIVPALLMHGIDGLDQSCGMSLGIPLKPMLGIITRDLSDMFTKVQGREFTCEFKYDGQRAQVHCSDDGTVHVFSRNLENMTAKYPDVVSLVPQMRGDKVRSFILEGEVVAVDVYGNLQSFQTLSNRGKRNVDIRRVKVDVCFFAFDLMYLNGESLLDKPFRERRGYLRSMFSEIPNKFAFAHSLDANCGDREEVEAFFKAATEFKCEGIMVKVLDSTDDQLSSQSLGRKKPFSAHYEPDKRLEAWLKVKKDYSSGAESLDLVPIGAWHGSGRKAGWWSPVLLACRDLDTGVYQAVCKCISGFTDSFYKALKLKYAQDGPNVTYEKSDLFESNLKPDIWFKPSEVWEIKGADITLSPVYTAAAGLVSENRGLSLRFPRFLRLREDKSLEEVSTPQDLAHMWHSQEEGKA